MRSSSPAWSPPGALVVAVRLAIVAAVAGVILALLL
jgi:hypothetical protein